MDFWEIVGKLGTIVGCFYGVLKIWQHLNPNVARVIAEVTYGPHILAPSLKNEIAELSKNGKGLDLSFRVSYSLSMPASLIVFKVSNKGTVQATGLCIHASNLYVKEAQKKGSEQEVKLGSDGMIEIGNLAPKSEATFYAWCGSLSDYTLKDLKISHSSGLAKIKFPGPEVNERILMDIAFEIIKYGAIVLSTLFILSIFLPKRSKINMEIKESSQLVSGMTSTGGQVKEKGTVPN